MSCHTFKVQGNENDKILKEYYAGKWNPSGNYWEIPALFEQFVTRYLETKKIGKEWEAVAGEVYRSSRSSSSDSCSSLDEFDISDDDDAAVARKGDIVSAGVVNVGNKRKLQGCAGDITKVAKPVMNRKRKSIHRAKSFDESKLSSSSSSLSSEDGDTYH